MDRFYFPAWINKLIPLIGLGAVLGGGYAGGTLYYLGNPKTTDVGYAPVQPVPFSHATHAGKLKMDCRYCHTSVEKAAFAAIPPTKTCINCHSGEQKDGNTLLTAVHSQSPKLAPVRASWETGKSVPWVKVHDLPDYAYFNHSAHVTRGVSCVSCHGRIDKMEVVRQDQPLSMGWCLECHRNPEPHLRPVEFVTKLDWKPDEDPKVLGARLRKENNINPSTDCSTCHR
jgi:menaquinone reductase, multiheme cytochrome c subunit